MGTPVSFTASATDISPAVQAAGFTYNWNFGDGTTATGASPSHSFAAAGTYTVTATATDEYGKTGTASATIVVTNPNPTGTNYTLTAPNPATGSVGTASGAFTVALPTGRTVASPVTVTPSDGGAGGTFTPAQLSLSTANPTATFTYTPVSAGAITITTTNNAGLTNPGPVLFLAANPALTTEQFEFGTPTSPVDPGFTKVDAWTTYSAAVGYGWSQGTNIEQIDRGVGSDMDALSTSRPAP